MHFQVTTSVTRKWVPKGSKPRVGSAPCRRNAPYSGFVRPDTGELFVTKPSWFNYETTTGSIREMLGAFGAGKVHLVLDNAPWHKKAARLIREDPGYADVRERVEPRFLPPYSPDLNPIEQVWRVTRREVTHNVYFPDVGALADALDGYFAGLREPNEKLRSLCTFKHKDK